jgi:LysM repeat protein
MKSYKIVLAVILALATTFSYAQHKGNIVNHIIKQGETISSIARQYNASVAEIFKANNLNDKVILRIGQKIVVPTTKTVATTTPSIALKPVVNPIAEKNQYLIVTGDNLSKIAKLHKVTEQQLKDWNGLKNDNIRAGDLLYISIPATTKATTTPTPEKPVVLEVKPLKVEPVKKVEPIPTVVKTPVLEKPVDKEIKTQPIVKMPAPNVAMKQGDAYFESQYASTQNVIEGLSGTFKTIAGWHDKKFYVLLNNVESGTVVKVTANNKFVFAKVLGPLPDIKEDNNLILRVSNATAAALGIDENKFTAKVNF